MMTHLLMDLPTWTSGVTHAGDMLQTLHWHMPDDWMVLAQQFKEPDFTGDVGKAWGHFVKTGQIWALLVGLVVGYLVKALTSFG
jgi:hypothetical protein